MKVNTSLPWHCIFAAEYYGLDMKAAFLRWGSSVRSLSLISFIIATATFAQADQVDMQNGDRYTGKVLSLESNTVVLSSELLGTLRLRRDKVALVSIGTKPTSGTETSVTVPKAPPVPIVSASSGPNPRINLNSSLSHHIAANPNLVNEIRSQVLAGAGPKALQKYDSIVDGLSTGNLNVTDVRNQAASVAAQLRQLRSSGDEDSEIFDEYLAILDHFLVETRTTIPPGKPAGSALPPVSKGLKSSPPAATAKPTISARLDNE